MSYRVSHDTFSGGGMSPRLVVLSLMGALLVAGVCAEAVVRAATADRLAERMGNRLSTTVDVGLGTTPVLYQITRGTFPNVEVSGDGASFRNFRGVDFDAHLSNVRRDSSQLDVSSSMVTAVLPVAALADTVSQAMGNSGGAGIAVSTDPGAGELVVHAGPAQMVTVTMKPQLKGDSITLQRGRVMVGKRALPDDLAGQ